MSAGGPQGLSGQGDRHQCLKTGLDGALAQRLNVKLGWLGVGGGGGLAQRLNVKLGWLVVGGGGLWPSG